MSDARAQTEPQDFPKSLGENETCGEWENVLGSVDLWKRVVSKGKGVYCVE